MTSLDWILIAVAVLVCAAAVFYLWWRIRDPEFWLDLGLATLDRIWDAVGPKIIAKLTARMPPDEEKAWNEFRRSNPDKREEQKWLRDYQKRKKAREAAAAFMNSSK